MCHTPALTCLNINIMGSCWYCVCMNASYVTDLPGFHHKSIIWRQQLALLSCLSVYGFNTKG